jgi:hypothetical protein
MPCSTAPRTLVVIILAAMALSACRTDRDRLPPVEPVDPDAVIAEGDTARTPLGVPDHVGEAGIEATARIDAVGGSDLTGMVLIQQVGTAAHVLAEIGGLQNREYRMRIVDSRSCAELDDPGTLIDLGSLDIADDGSGLLDERAPGLDLTGSRSVVGYVVVVAQGGDGGRIVGCGVIGPTVQ